MAFKTYAYLTIIPLFFLFACQNGPKEKKIEEKQKITQKDTISPDSVAAPKEKKEKEFVLTDDNAINFFFKYNKTLKDNKVKITTRFGSFTIQLFNNVPYHKANFIYLTKKGYFNNTMFHRVVKNFIIQGGNADNKETGIKRSKIGRYLLPPDGHKGHRHDRGVVSMPSSDIDNPHMLASPYEFFIVVAKHGAHHLDGDYTPFGKVIDGMDVVDKINQQPVGKGDWPVQNIYILKAEVVK